MRYHRAAGLASERRAGLARVLVAAGTRARLVQNVAKCGPAKRRLAERGLAKRGLAS
jgi:hypothetical protein